MDQNIQLLRQDIRSKKKQTVAANLQLTDAQATKFWPIYDQYTGELIKINDEKYAILKQYADEWGNMTDAQALSLTNRALAVEQKVTELRIKYVPIFSQVVPGTTVATFFQIERRLQGGVGDGHHQARGHAVPGGVADRQRHPNRVRLCEQHLDCRARGRCGSPADEFSRPDVESAFLARWKMDRLQRELRRQ